MSQTETEENVLGRLVANLIWGSGIGLLFGAILACVGAVIYLVQGAAAFERAGTRPGIVILLYLVGGVIAGAIVGVLRPLASRGWGAALVGVVAALPIYALFRLAMGDLGPWSEVDTISAAVFSVFLGGPVGFGYWKMFRGF